MSEYIKTFNEIGINDVEIVGGKNASLGEMYRKLSEKGVKVPNGFATTSKAYWLFLDRNNLRDTLKKILDGLDTKTFANLSTIAEQARTAIMNAQLPDELLEEILSGYENLVKISGKNMTVAVRSSATAEDLPNASFAGQQDTYLNVDGAMAVIKAVQRCYASLFTDRAIKYRYDNGFQHDKVALSIGIQIMVRSDLASSGVIFTLDPDSGFDKVVVITGGWGLGENIVQGTINTDEFIVYKDFIDNKNQPIISRKLGSKAKTMIYAKPSNTELLRSEDAIINTDTTLEKQEQYILTDKEVISLAKWSVIIEDHYKRPMDIEWAKDGITGELYIVQARPETVQSRRKRNVFHEYKLTTKGKVLCTGTGLGDKIAAGTARILNSPNEAYKLQEGEILVTSKTSPDWDPILKKAAAIITDQGGRTSHAAIVAREVGAVAVVGTGNGTLAIKDGQQITVSCAGGETGMIYDGILTWEEKDIDIAAIQMPEQTHPMLILGDPDQAFTLSALPNAGIGLMRLEFIIANAIRIHPMALVHFDKLKDLAAKEEIQNLTHHYQDKKDYFIHKLAESVAVIAAAFYPKPVIVRMSDFKSNEYANLIGGKEFEPVEANPMIGFRGASRYYHPKYKEGFDLECRAMKMVREEMGFDNVKLMIPFCRTLTEAEKVINVMAENGLNRYENGLELYMMTEIPSNVILAKEFAEHFDGFSIGSNDLTQLTLGADRDSELLSEIFDPHDPAVKKMIVMLLESAKQTGTYVSFCGQAPSDFPEYAQFLVEHGINSISFNPDALIKGIENINITERTPVMA